jgi:carbamoyl-phosphate synthase large subunit
VTEVILREKPDALLPTVGGSTAMALANACDRGGLLEDNGIRLLGATDIPDPDRKPGGIYR